jgi:basic membrane protein A
MKFRSSVSVIALVLAAVVIGPTPANAANKICIAYDTGGLGDLSINDATLAGVKKAQAQMTFTFEGVVTDGTAADRTKRLRSLVGKSCEVIIAVGSEY